MDPMAVEFGYPRDNQTCERGDRLYTTSNRNARFKF